MDKNSNAYILIYAAALTIIVAVVLALISESLKAPQQANQLLAKKVDILKSVGRDTVANPEAYFEERISGVVLNASGEVQEGVNPIDIDLKAQRKLSESDQLFPLFVFTGEDNTKKFIIPMRGGGLWGAIWGYIAINDDFQTVAGVSFDHESETPGLGAEIKTDWFQTSFVGKSIYDKKGSFVGITVKKGEMKSPENQVMSISGATITGDGVTAMITNDVSKYLGYFATQQ